MKTFADIAPAYEAVDIRGQVFELRGLSMRKLCDLIVKYPAVVALLVGQIDAAGLVSEAPDAAASVVAHAMGRGDDEVLKKSFDDNLVLGEQVELLAAVVKASKPKGDGPFVDLRRGLSGDQQPSQTSATNSGSPSQS